MDRHHPTTADIVKVVGYVRVSTANQADSGAGLTVQREALEAECKRKGWELVQIYEDTGSGKAMKNRPALAAALECLRRHEADALVVSKVDRLSRSLLDFAALLERSSDEGWRVVPLDLGVDLATGTGRFIAQIMGAFAEMERGIIAQRTRDALAVKKAEGVRLGMERSIPDDVAGHIIAMRHTGATLRAIADRLNADGVPTTKGGPWQPSTIQRVLNREDTPEGLPHYRRGPRPAAPAKPSHELETVTAFQCAECAAILLPDDTRDAGPLYECNDCAERFTRDNSADGYSNRCPFCNKFSAKAADHACPECEAGELEELQAVEVDGELIPLDEHHPITLASAS
jgi:DNA invertase Pin-like site-specific DNA recombinase